MAWWTSGVALMLVSIFINSSGSTALPASCPPGWLTWRQSCYIEMPDKMDWSEGSEACSRPGSMLAAPNSQAENDFIWEAIVKKNNRGYWIGCTDAAQEGVWLCGGQPADYTNWFPPEHVSDQQHNCARMTTESQGQWGSNVPCTDHKWVVCEMLATTVPAYHTFTGPDGRVPQSCLLDHDIQSLTVDGLLACGWACRADPRCRSFNLWQISKREKMCQLNDVTRLGADGNDYLAVDNCYYFDL